MTIEQAFRDDFPPAMLQELADGVRHVIVRTEAGLAELLHNDDEKRNLRPWLRRALMEQTLRGVAELHPEVANAESRLDESGFWFHVHLNIGRFIITQHALADDEVALRPAGYKEQAAAANQLFLFDDVNDIDIPDDTTPLYAVLVYGRCPDNSLAFAKIKFPKPNVANGFLQGEIDLIAQFPTFIGTALTTAPVEEILESEMPVMLQNNTGA